MVRQTHQRHLLDHRQSCQQYEWVLERLATPLLPAQSQELRPYLRLLPLLRHAQSHH
jgi:hypothetical protein